MRQQTLSVAKVLHHAKDWLDLTELACRAGVTHDDTVTALRTLRQNRQPIAFRLRDGVHCYKVKFGPKLTAVLDQMAMPVARHVTAPPPVNPVVETVTLEGYRHTVVESRYERLQLGMPAPARAGALDHLQYRSPQGPHREMLEPTPAAAAPKSQKKARRTT